MTRHPRVPLLLLFAGLVAATAAPSVAAGFRLERELALDPGGRFELDTDAGSIELRGADRSGVRLVVTSRRNDVEERFDFRFEEGGEVARVEVKRRGGLISRWLSSSGERLEFTVEVPRPTDVELDTAGGSIDVQELDGRATVDTSGGSLRLAGIRGEVEGHTSGGSIQVEALGASARLDTSGGSIRVDGVDGDLRAETSGGSITVAGVRGDARLETSGGSIELSDVGGFVRAHTSGGPVRARFAAGNGSGGSLSSSGGGITATVDPAVGLAIDAATSGGRVTLDLPVTVQGSVSKSSVRGSLNGGGPELKLRSSGGSIHLRSL